MAKHFDIIIIGGGPGGYVAAIRCSQLGMRVALIDKRETLGGTCLNVGCIPSKSLLHSSEIYSTMSQTKELGIDIKGFSCNFKKMMQNKEETILKLSNGIDGLIKKNKITRFTAHAQFVSLNELELSHNKTKERVTADKFILATGSESISLPFLPIDEKRILSSTGALSLKKIPKNLVVIGAGVIGVELASVYQRLGSEVTIIEMLDRIVPPVDLGISKTFLQILTKQGLKFHLSTALKQADISPKEITLTLENKQTIQADTVLVAVGRRPYSDQLGLDAINLSCDEQGFLPVDNQFHTTHPHIFAIGDLIRGPMLAHRASLEGTAVAEIIAGQSPTIDYITIPNVIYTTPEVASVGLSEEEAKKAKIPLLSGTSHFRANSRAHCAHQEEGLVKVLGDKRSGKLIGLHIVGHQASEMISAGVVALQKRMTVEEIANGCFPHPTLSEAIKEAALTALGKAIHA